MELAAVTEDWITYDLPPELNGKVWGGRYRGQAQIWVLFRFTGRESEIDLTATHQEFSRWKWTRPEVLINEIVGFKRDTYRAVLAAFAPALKMHCPDLRIVPFKPAGWAD